MIKTTYFLWIRRKLSIVSSSESMIRGCEPLKLLNCIVKFSINCSIFSCSFYSYFFFEIICPMKLRASLM